ncbi:hypothetical protein ACQR1W_35315 [Bradyrhizobium sp. HKCCYLS1011]|uniref:hypothetical protein n=1 Tax=Bradyrhizobium sp. HKCCYLS1011 TaxID=3420733 RepID=UPI003EC05BF5
MAGLAREREKGSSARNEKDVCDCDCESSLQDSSRPPIHKLQWEHCGFRQEQTDQMEHRESHSNAYEGDDRRKVLRDKQHDKDDQATLISISVMANASHSPTLKFMSSPAKQAPNLGLVMTIDAIEQCQRPDAAAYDLSFLLRAHHD